MSSHMLYNLSQFLRGLGAKGYVLAGSGSCAKHILDLISLHGLQAPKMWVEEGTADQTYKNFQLDSIANIPEDIPVLLASEQYAEEIRQKLRKGGKQNVAFGIFEVAADADAMPVALKSEHPVIINTIPKCGNAFIRKTITKSMGVPCQYVSAGPWPDMVLSEYLLEDLRDSNGFVVDHIPATPFNISILRQFNISKMVLHVRDPRQATLSWLHWIDKKHSNGTLLEWECPGEDPTYFSKPLEAKIDVLIQHWIPTITGFIEPWVALQDAGIDVLMTDFNEMKTQPDEFFQKIFAHFGFASANLEISSAQSEKSHFRKGLSNEWAEVFSKEQLEIANSLIRRQLKDRFHWL